MNTMTPLDLDALADTIRRASPLPWRWWTSNSFRRLSSDATMADGDVLRGCVHPHDGHHDVCVSEENMAAIVETMNAAPALLAELRAARERIGVLEAALVSIDREIEKERQFFPFNTREHNVMYEVHVQAAAALKETT